MGFGRSCTGYEELTALGNSSGNGSFVFELIVSEEGVSSVKLWISWGHSDVGKQGWWFKPAEKEAQA